MRQKLLNSVAIVMLSNLVALIFGICMSFLLPKLMSGVEDYGYWQLYYYYTGFYGLFLFGLNDGINLIYSGKRIENLDRMKFTAYLTYIIMSTAILTLVAAIAVIILVDDINLKRTFLLAVLNIAILNISGFCLHINQMTLNFKKYARLNILERVLFVAMFVPFWLFSTKVYWIFIIANLAIRFIVMVYGLSTVRKLINKKSITLSNTLAHKSDILTCIKAGFPLTIAAIASMLIMSSPRIVVEKTLSIRDYGLFSLGFSALSVIIIIVSALSTVLYPSLKTIGKKYYEGLNSIIKYVVSYLCVISMSLCFLIPYFIDYFLPQYSSVKNYLFILFPWLVYQCISSIINDVFYRLVRMERRLLINNIIGLVFILVSQFVTMKLFSNLNLTLAVGLFVLMIWAHANDIYLHIKEKWKMNAFNFIDIPFVIGFIIISIYCSGLFGFVLYIVYVIILSLILFQKNLQVIRTLVHYIKDSKEKSIEDMPILS